MLVPAPESTAWVSLSEAREVLKHFLGRIGFEHDLSGLNGVLFWDVHQEMDMVECKAEFPELKTETFQVVERLEKGFDIDLFSKTVIPVVGDEHHGHPVITGVTRNLFRAIANYIYHTIFFSCRTFRGQAKCLPRATKNRYSLIGEKRDAAFHLRVLR